MDWLLVSTTLAQRKITRSPMITIRYMPPLLGALLAALLDALLTHVRTILKWFASLATQAQGQIRRHNLVLRQQLRRLQRTHWTAPNRLRPGILIGIAQMLPWMLLQTPRRMASTQLRCVTLLNKAI